MKKDKFHKKYPTGKSKVRFTDQRYELRNMLWEKVKMFVRWHIEQTPRGTASRIAQMVGVTPSQIHRFTCPVCEHDQEPTFTVGMAVFLATIIDREHNARTIDLGPKEISVITLRKL